MKNLFHFVVFSFIAALFFSCSNGTSENVNSNELNIKQASTHSIKSEAQPVAVANRDTLPPAKKATTQKNKKSSVRYTIDTSRPKNKIKQDFPFDIPMTNVKREKLNSKTVLKKNGKPTVVLFWLTTCYPCRMELNAIKKKYPQWKTEADFNLVAISTDFQKNYEKFISRVEKENWGWETFHDTDREFKKVIPGQLNGLPQTFIFDKDGNIVYHKRKYQTGDEDKLFEEVKKYL